MVHLVITEKPSVARDIARVFNVKTKRDGYFESERIWITWCFGHMVQLAEPGTYHDAWSKWRRDQLPMVPDAFKLAPISSSRDQLKILKSLMKHKDVRAIVNACDAGREGELIFRYVYDLCGAKKPIKRAWLASMTDAAIKKAFKQLDDGEQYDNLADAARCRSEADWLIGLNATRAMTIQCRAAGGGDVMSIGRVQTPTLAMIVNREREIEAFVPEDFWQVYATFDASPQEEGLPTTYEGLWSKNKVDRFTDKTKAQAVIDACANAQGKVTKVQHKDIKERPPMLYDLTALQRAANQRYGFSAQKTLDVAQKLYEKHKLLTYPRTDSNHLTTDMKKGLSSIIKSVNVEPYNTFCDHLTDNLPLKVTKRIVDDDEVGDHHAIIPTNKTPDLSKLDDQELKIYDLVVRRFLAAFYNDAIFATTTIETTVLDEHVFTTKGKMRKEAGWQAVDPPSRAAREANKADKKPSKSKEKDQPLLPKVQRGQDVPVDKTRLHQGKTKPPNRYSESGLLGAMERAGQQLDDATLKRALKESGLGTPATRASIIETLLKRQFIQRAKKNLVPTDKGRALIDAISMDVLKSPQLTGQWEAKLTHIAQGKHTRTQFMEEVRALTREVTTTILASVPDLPEAATTKEILGKCPICKTPVTEGFKAYSCATGRDCSFVIFKNIASRKISPGLVKVLLTGKTSQVLKGFKSKKTNKSFQAALRLDNEGKATFVFDNTPQPTQPRAQQSPEPPTQRDPRPQPPAQNTTPRPSRMDQMTCPKCRQGHLIKGKKGWGCARWREGCNFVLWFEVQGQSLSEEIACKLLSEGQITHDAQTLTLDLGAPDHVTITQA